MVLVWLLAGCTPSYVQQPLPVNHPANPVAPQAAFEKPPESLTAQSADTVYGLGGVEPVAGMDGMHNMDGMPGMNMEEKPGMDGMHNMDGMPGMNMEEKPEMDGMHNMDGMPGMNHGGRTDSEMEHQGQQLDAAVTSLPEEASGYLTQLLSAYLAIGDLLASDIFDDIHENVREIISAVGALDKMEIDENSTIWRLKENDSRAIRKHTQELELAPDLSTSRAAYRSMSVVLVRLFADTGVPGSYQGPVNRFVCGVNGKESEIELWLQIGDDVRNPFRGNHTTDCRTEITPFPESRVIPDANKKEPPEQTPGQGGQG